MLVIFSVFKFTRPNRSFYISNSRYNSYILFVEKNKKIHFINNPTKTFTFGSPTPFTTIDISGDDIIGILDIVDSNDNVWYEVDYLAQEMVYNNIKNTNPNDLIM